MDISSSQRLVLAYVHSTFPTTWNAGDQEKILPRSKHQPPSRIAILESLKMEPALLDDALEFLTAHNLVVNVYRFGADEFTELHVAPGRVIRAPVAVGRPKDPDPTDPRYGVYCFQITERGVAALARSTPQQLGGTIAVFSSYSHRDEKYRQKFETHVSVLKREGIIAVWNDHKITAGKDLDRSIAEELERATIILLFISPDFLASDYCYNVELSHAIDRHEAGTARVIPIIVRPCDWHSAPFGKLKALPRDGKAVTEWSPQDKAFLDVARAIREVVKELNHLVKPPNPSKVSDHPGEVQDDDVVSLTAKLSVTATSELIGRVGCPCLYLNLVCTSKRPAKLKGVELRIRGPHHIKAFQDGFGTDFGYNPPRGEPDPNDSLGFCFIPASPPNSPNGFIVERDDACKFILPGFGFPMLLFTEGSPDDVSVVVEYIDSRRETVLDGIEVQGQIGRLLEMCKAGQYALNPMLIIEMKLHVKSGTIPNVSAVGSVNEREVTFEAVSGVASPDRRDSSHEGRRRSALSQEFLVVQLEASGRMASMPPFGSYEPLHLAIDLTLINMGDHPIFIVSAQLKDKSGRRNLGFSGACSETEPLMPGARRLETLKLLSMGSSQLPLSESIREDRQQRYCFEMSLLSEVCQPDSYFEVLTARGEIHRFPATEVCDEQFLGWPFYLPQERPGHPDDPASPMP